MLIDRSQVCIFIPTLNEEPTIGELISRFRERGYSHIFVMDGNSTDRTAELAEKAGAEVVLQKSRGKGNAIIESIEHFRFPYILMLDGDLTYLPEDAELMLEPLFSGCDHVIGNRLEFPEKGALSHLNLFGNKVINDLFRMAHGRYLADILSGYRAFTLESIRQMHLREEGFGIETEISSESIRNQQKIHVVPVHYVKRPGTATKLRPFHDGAKIISTLYRLAKRSNPMFYFGMIGGVITILGALTGVYVVYEWLNGIEHLPLTILTALLVMGGIQVFMFGILSDIMLSNQQELRREIQSLKSQKPPK
ncbi:S-layer glycoprotein N-glycosyltransferase AglJ [Methanogenium sp. S4BF]|uniref:S-layer glycoprotein N-glycosyltransferase AglJ n=1 Tax=Methanogenium sp. S4BF TaxID=1789226 RepID=UPI0024168B94|nr:S-layer glycoprotein N-glycosyltransferase AglJ [Methanogenium sp. S4BF]WFN34866.1 S-layer glycoprotein N-glycosyltransferase AglJ [Methanogenium sp. S4BF]